MFMRITLCIMLVITKNIHSPVLLYKGHRTPTPTQKVCKMVSCARVLTSTESNVMLEEKFHRKREEQEGKEQKKRER